MAIRFFTVEQLGESQALTPEGFLLCDSVPIARTGTMKYGPGEVPIPAGPDGYVLIERDENEVFREEFMASFAGKPVTDDHPPEDVTPANWKTYAVGTVLNPRRGMGMQMDLLIADLMITDPITIRDIKDGKREISCGYDAEYDETSVGHGKQYNMVGNHVALVDSGRCGSRCSISDSKTFTGDCDMKTQDKSVKDNEEEEKKAKEAQAAKDAEEEEKKKAEDAKAYDAEEVNKRFQKIEDALEELSASHKEMKDMMKGKDKAKDDDEEEKKKSEDAEAEEEEKKAKDRKGKDNEAVEEELEKEAPAGHEKDAKKARDSVYLEDSFQETVAQAEILVPGIRIPTFDRKESPKSTLDTICRLRRNALDLANNTPEGRGIIEEVNGKTLDLDKMSCGQVRNVFKASVAIKKHHNSTRVGDFENKTSAGTGVKGPVRTPAELNKMLQDYWAKN